MMTKKHSVSCLCLSVGAVPLCQGQFVIDKPKHDTSSSSFSRWYLGMWIKPVAVYWDNILLYINMGCHCDKSIGAKNETWISFYMVFIAFIGKSFLLQPSINKATSQWGDNSLINRTWDAAADWPANIIRSMAVSIASRLYTII